MSDRTSAERTMADLMVERLSAWGIDRVFGYSGDGNNPFLGALRRAAEGPRFIQARHEESAAFMAVGHAKYSGLPGVVTATQGPGAVHLLNGLYDAKLDSVPVVAIVGQQYSSALGSGYQQEIDLRALFQDVAADFTQLALTPEQLPMLLDRAFRSALTNSKPTVVIVPHDVQQQPVPSFGQEHGVVVTAPLWSRANAAPRPEDLQAAADIVNAGQKIAMLVGRGAANAQQEVALVAERLGAGIVTSLLGKPYVDESLPLAAGTMGHLGTTASAQILQGCDTLLIVGSNDPWTEFYPPPGQARAVQIDIDGAKTGNRYPVDVGVVADASLALAELLPLLTERQASPWRTEVETHIRNWHEIAAARALTPAQPLNPELLVSKLSDRIPADAQVSIDVGSSVYWYVRQLRLPRGVPAHLSSTLASMGCALPYGIAAKLLHPHRPVISLAGDGAMQMLGINELITISRMWPEWEDPRFVIVVLSNGDLSEVSWEQREMESEPRFEASQALPEFDYAGYAEHLGLLGVKLSIPTAIDRVLDEAMAADRPIVVDARTDPDIPLLPPFPHGKAKLEPMRKGLEAEGAAGVHGLELLNAYAAIEQRFA